jgi:hypothetical protein
MKSHIAVFALAVSFALPVVLQAQPSAHYVPGSEGIDCATLPPPGIYVRDYNLAYYSTRLNNSSGDNANVPNFRAFTYANVPRVIWITDVKFLGGYLGVDGLVPLIYNDLRVPGYNQGTFGVGDVFGEGTLSWHIKQFDFALGSGVWMPEGDSPTSAGPSTRAGLGYWTFMQTAGATWYVDDAKTWAVSLLNRYEFNTEQADTHITPGQAWTAEWGISKKFAKIVDVGPVGYYQQQVTTDSGPKVSSDRNRVAAVGPEVNVVIPKLMLFISARYEYEFLADSRAQGETATITLTKRF